MRILILIITLMVCSYAWATHMRIIVTACKEQNKAGRQIVNVSIVGPQGRIWASWDGEDYKKYMNEWARKHIKNWDRHPTRMYIVNRGLCPAKRQL